MNHRNDPCFVVGRNGVEQLIVVINDETDTSVPADSRLCLRRSRRFSECYSAMSPLGTAATNPASEKLHAVDRGAQKVIRVNERDARWL
ncbi:MAG: hypothetical protein EOS23_03710 [Mesorhizobium sp.]|nr:MAG: hypothetical protein EOS23_03710 [Mesorhizobium sp.]